MARTRNRSRGLTLTRPRAPTAASESTRKTGRKSARKKRVYKKDIHEPGPHSIPVATNCNQLNKRRVYYLVIRILALDLGSSKEFLFFYMFNVDTDVSLGCQIQADGATAVAGLRVLRGRHRRGVRTKGKFQAWCSQRVLRAGGYGV